MIAKLLTMTSTMRMITVVMMMMITMMTTMMMVMMTLFMYQPIKNIFKDTLKSKENNVLLSFSKTGDHFQYRLQYVICR